MQSIEQRLRSGRPTIEFGQDKFALLTLFICLVTVIIELNGAVQANQYNQDDLSGYNPERHWLGPGPSEWRIKRQAAPTTTSTTHSPQPTAGSATSTHPTTKPAESTSTTHTPGHNTTSSPPPANSTTAGPTNSSSLTTSHKPATTTTVKPVEETTKKHEATTTTNHPAQTTSAANTTTSHPTSGPSTGPPAPTTTSKPHNATMTTSLRPTEAANTTTTSKPMNTTGPTAPVLPVTHPTIAPNKTVPVGPPRVKPTGGPYEARDVAAYLDSHQTHSLIDPRVYFTQQSPLGALAKLRDDMLRVPERLRYAYVMRTINELGAKIASRLNMYNSHMLALLSKKPDGLGEKPGLSAYMSAVGQTLAAYEDAEIVNSNEATPTTTAPVNANNSNSLGREPTSLLGLPELVPLGPLKVTDPRRLKTFNLTRKTISSLISADKDKEILFKASLSGVANGFARAILDFLLYDNGTNSQLFKSAQGDKRLRVLGAALNNGAKNMVELMESDDKFRPESDNIDHMNQLFNETMSVVMSHAHNESVRKFADPQQAFGFIGGHQRMLLKRVNPNGLSDANGLVGPWNSFLFEQLGTSERVVRVFATLLASIRENPAKTRFVNMYMPQVRQALSKTMSSFVALQAVAQPKEPSENYLVDYYDEKTLIKNATVLNVHQNQEIDKTRLPARCYLAGRRWRLLLNMAMRHYDDSQNTINMFVDKINQMKTALQSLQPGSTELERVCLPRLEVGLKGWGINGEPTGVSDEKTNKFPLRTPIEGLNKDEDPFTGGARMGYRLGFMIGYNDKRNQSLEMEKGAFIHRKLVKPEPALQSDTAPRSAEITTKPPCGDFCHYNSTGTTTSPTTEADKKEEERKRKAEVDYLARASYRQGLTAGARRALEIACREGYMATLQVSVRAGMLLPLEAGSSLGSLKGSNFASQVGGEAGRTFVNSYLMERDHLDEKTRSSLMEVGMTHGTLAGRQIGEMIGSITGHESALEAYRRAITRGGKVVRAKFHLDEFLAGALVGFDFGLDEGGRVAQSSSLSPSAPKFFKLAKPEFSAQISSAFGQPPKNESSSNSSTTTPPPGSRSGLIHLPASLPVISTTSAATDDHWGQDLITPLSDKNIEDFHRARNHTRVIGTFKGTYNVAKEVKRGLQRESFANLTYDLEVSAIGFAMNDVTYLSLSGKINNANVLHGSLVAQNIITEDK